MKMNIRTLSGCNSVDPQPPAPFAVAQGRLKPLPKIKTPSPQRGEGLGEGDFCTTRSVTTFQDYLFREKISALYVSAGNRFVLIVRLGDAVAVLTAELVGCRDTHFLQHTFMSILDKIEGHVQGFGNILERLLPGKVALGDHDL